MSSFSPWRGKNTFGRAAEACGVTQPTLSAGVKQIEDQFGVLLVNRGSRFQGFTPEGERVLEWARRIVGDTRPCGRRSMRCDTALPAGCASPRSRPRWPWWKRSPRPIARKHPDVQFTVFSRTSIEILDELENLEIDAGLTYLDNEPLGRVNAVPLYRERYRLLVAADAPLAEREEVTWSEVAQVPLCLLTPDMQNRRIIERLLRETGAEPNITLKSDSMILLYSHVRTGRWASVMPAHLAASLGLTETIICARSRSSVPRRARPSASLFPLREPMTPLIAALVAEARRVAPLLAD